MSKQRRHGQPIKVWKTVSNTDHRGNVVKSADPEGPYELRAAVIPQRSARAELPGQSQINIVRLIVEPDLEDVTMWSRVEYLGKLWDIVTPPAFHNGPRHMRHWSIDIRERP